MPWTGSRRYFLVVALLGGLISPTTVLGAGSSPRAVIDAMLAAWNVHDPERVATLMADDVTYLDVFVGKPLKGRDNVLRELIQVFMTAAPDVKWEMKGEPIVAADSISFEWRFSGTNTGNWGPKTAASGKRFDFEGASFVRLKNGKIVYEADYYDALGFQRQLGWIK